MLTNTGVTLFCLLLSSSLSLSLLGAGEGRGSCPAPPYRAAKVNWPNGCPLHVPCCTEFGFCKTEAEWLSGKFRDCNGLSNGLSLPDDVIRLEAIYTAIENGLANGPIFNETAVIDTATGGVASAVILDVDDIQGPTAHTKAVVDGEGGGGGDGGDGGEGGFRGAGGDGGKGGNGGANGGNAGNGGLGGKGGAGAAGGNGGDGGDAGFFAPSQYNISIEDANGSPFRLIKQPSLMSIIGVKAGSGGGGGQGGDGVGKEKGANGGNGGTGGLGPVGGDGGIGGNGGKGGLNAAGGNGGNGGSGGDGITNVFLKPAYVEKTVPFENNYISDAEGLGGYGGDGGSGGDGGAGLGDRGELLPGGQGGLGGSGSNPAGPNGGQGGYGGSGGFGGGSAVLGGYRKRVQFPAGVTAEECPNYPYCTYDV